MNPQTTIGIQSIRHAHRQGKPLSRYPTGKTKNRRPNFSETIDLGSNKRERWIQGCNLPSERPYETQPGFVVPLPPMTCQHDSPSTRTGGAHGGVLPAGRWTSKIVIRHLVPVDSSMTLSISIHVHTRDSSQAESYVGRRCSWARIVLFGSMEFSLARSLFLLFPFFYHSSPGTEVCCPILKAPATTTSKT